MTNAKKSAEIAKAMGLVVGPFGFGGQSCMVFSGKWGMFDPFTSWDDAGRVIRWIAGEVDEIERAFNVNMGSLQASEYTPALVAKAAYKAIMDSQESQS